MASHQNRLIFSLKQFLLRHWDGTSPLLLACSGGPDSKALLHLLVECKKWIGLKIHVAHVDHRWRPESAAEAFALKNEIENLKLPFYLCTLQHTAPKEAAARDARHAFLEQVAQEIGAQAVLMGHQMEDQAETVLKRVLEGASLACCKGMMPVSEWKGRAIWRPLLGACKQALVEWLDQKGISYVEDKTNLSPDYLRGRFRTAIFPSLEASFGKSIVKNLCRLGERADRLEQYLIRQVEPLWRGVCDKSNICLSIFQGIDETVVEYFLKQWTKSQKIDLSSDQLTVLVRMVMVRDTQIQVRTSNLCLRVEGGKLALKKIYDYLKK